MVLTNTFMLRPGTYIGCQSAEDYLNPAEAYSVVIKFGRKTAVLYIITENLQMGGNPCSESIIVINVSIFKCSLFIPQCTSTSILVGQGNYVLRFNCWFEGMGVILFIVKLVRQYSIRD